MATIFSHIKTAFYTINAYVPLKDPAWVGRRLDKLICSTGVYHIPPTATDRPLDYSLALAANPDLEIFPYISTSNARFSYSGTTFSDPLEWRDFLDWLDSPYLEENAMWHYKYDFTESAAGDRRTHVLVPGYAIGLIPGYDLGSASRINHSWVISQRFGSLATMVVPSLSIATIGRASGVVTVTTSAIHHFTLGERVTIAGVSDASFNGSFDFDSVGTNTFTFTQAGADVPPAALGGTASQSYWYFLYKNVFNPEWKQYFIDSFSDARGSSYEWLRDRGGNILKGPYLDSILNMAIAQGSVPGDADTIRWDLTREYLADGGNVGDSREVKAAWLYAKIGAWFKGIKDGLAAYMAGKGKTGKNAANGDSVDYVYNHRTFYQQDYVDVILLESGLEPSTAFGASLFSNYLKTIWDLMETYGKEVIYQGRSNINHYYINYHGTPLAWEPYTGTIYFTDLFSNNKTPLSMVSVQIGGVTRTVLRDSTITSPSGLPVGKLFHDMTTGRLYANFGYEPVMANNYTTQGLDPDRFFNLAIYYLWGRHTDKGYFAPMEYTRNWVYDVDPIDSWYQAIETDIGQPMVGGLKLDGTPATDMWGSPCSSSSRVYEAWRNPIQTNDQLWARSFDNAVVVARPRYTYGYTDTMPGCDYRAFQFTGFQFRILRSDGTLGPVTDTVSLAYGEGAILMRLDEEEEDQEPIETFSDFLKTRVHTLRQPAPILQFYEVAIPDGTFQRYVDFADRDAGGSLPSKVPFNGVEWNSVAISRGEIPESADGASIEMPVSVYDPTHAGAYFLRTFEGLVGQAVRFYLIPYDDLTHPEDAFQETFEVIHSIVSQGPDTITITLGHPNLYETRIPKTYYDRRKCHNPFHDRFTAGNRCSYPSNEFGAARAEDLIARAIYGDQERAHGWWTSQGRRASTFDVNLDLAGALSIGSSELRIAWNGRERYGPAFWRPIAGDFDLETHLVLAVTTRASWFAGLLVQDEAEASPLVSGLEELPTSPASSWAIWGANDDGAGSNRLRWRTTVANAPTVDSTVVSTDLFLRLKRIGNALTAYSKATAGDAWTSRATATLVLPTTARVGVLLSADSRTADPAKVRFEYLRFTAGGLGTCKRTWEDCIARGNMVEYNGFREMPSDRARY